MFKGFRIFKDMRRYQEMAMWKVPEQLIYCNGSFKRIFRISSPKHLIQHYQAFLSAPHLYQYFFNPKHFCHKMAPSVPQRIRQINRSIYTFIDRTRHRFGKTGNPQCASHTARVNAFSVVDFPAILEPVKAKCFPETSPNYFFAHSSRTDAPLPLQKTPSPAPF